MKGVAKTLIILRLLIFSLRFVCAGTLDVVPFNLGTVGNATAQWTTADTNTGSYSVNLTTTSSLGDYSYVDFSPLVLTIDGVTSLSFYYKHVLDNGWAGPRIAIMINDSGTYYMVVSGAASNTTNWSKADGITGDNLTTCCGVNPDEVWWYGTCKPNGTNYNQTGGPIPINFSEIKNTLNGNIVRFSVYMGVVGGAGVQDGQAYVDDIEINGLIYYGKIQDAIDTAISDDTVYVNDGIYNENVTVNKPLRIAGSGYSSTSIINCSGSGTGMLINSSNVIVSGFKIINCENGIYIQGTTNTIVNNSFNFNINGINISEALNNKINFNVIEGNTKFGIKNVDNDIVNATYNWWGDCSGPYHPTTNPDGQGDEVSDNVSYTPWLGICITNKTNVTCAIETDDVTLEADVSGLEIQDVWFSYTTNLTNHNKTALNVGGDRYQVTIPNSELVGGKNVTWNVYVRDSINVYNNSWKTFYVRKRTNLSVNPALPDGSNGWYVTEPIFTLTKDTNGTKIYYQWDSKPSGPILYTAPFALENIPNLPKETAGILELNWWTDFGVCGNESVQSQIFKVDLTNPVIKDLEPENSSIVYNLRPNISAYLDEVYGSNSGINLTGVIMKIDGNIVSANVNPADDLDAIVWNISNLGIGKHTVIVNVTDNSGRMSGMEWSFNVTTTPALSMIVNSPQNGSYGNKRVAFNISINGSVNVLEYINYNERLPRWRTLCSRCSEYGNTSKKVKSLLEGNNTISIRAIDAYGNINITNRTLFIDSKEPKIISTLPRRNSIVNGSNFLVKYSEDNLRNVTLNWNGSTFLNCTSGINQECSTSVNLSDYDGKFIDYYFNVTDLVRTVKSRLTRVKVDTTPPELNVTMPKDGETYERNVPFSITVSEDVLLEYYNKSDSRPTTLCNNCDDYGNSTKKTKSFRKGSYNLSIRATDKAGQVDVEERSFVVS